MALAAVPEPQTAIDETLVDDPKLEQALRERQAAKDAASEARKVMAEAHEKVLTALEEHALDEGEAIRCGTWRIAKTHRESRHVEFDTSPATRIAIRQLDS